MIEQVQKVKVCLKRESETSLFPKGLGDQRVCKSIGICIQLSKNGSQNMHFLHNSKYFPKNYIPILQECDFNRCLSLLHDLQHDFHSPLLVMCMGLQSATHTLHWEC